MEVVKALNHVHSNVDTENQWNRAVSAIGKLSNLEKARAWIEFSEPVVRMEYSKAIVAHSQRRELFERCVSESAFLHSEVDNTQSSTIAESLLKETTDELKKSRELMKRLALLASRLDIRFKPDTGQDSDAQSQFESDFVDDAITPKANAANDTEKIIQNSASSNGFLQIEIDSLKTQYQALNEIFVQMTSNLGQVLNLTEKNSKDLESSNLQLIGDFNDRLDSLRAEVDIKFKELASVSNGDFNDRLDSLRAEVDIKIKELASASEHTVPGSVPNEGGIDDRPLNPVNTSTEMIETKTKLELVLSDIEAIKKRFTALENAGFNKLAISIGEGKKMKKIHAHILFNPFTGARRKTDKDPELALDALNTDFLSRFAYIKEIENRLKSEAVSQIAKTS